MTPTILAKHSCKMRVMAILVIVLIGIAGWVLVVRAWYLLQPQAYNWDAPVYWSIGKAWLQGMHPYIDIFEIKPPGIFILSAASFGLIGSPFVGNVMAAALVLAIPLILVASYWREVRTMHVERANFLLLCGALGGALLAAYTSIQGMPWQTELFGALFGMMYVVVAFRISKTSASRPLLTVWASLALLASAGFKEPFFLSCFAAALLLDSRPKALLRTFFIPFCIAAIVGIVVALATGILSPYFTQNIPLLIADRAAASDVPLWARGFQVFRVFAMLTAFTPWFSVAILFSLAITVHGAVTAGNRRHMTTRVSAIVAACYLATFSIALGAVFNFHHFAFAVPFYTALLFAALSALAEIRSVRAFRALGGFFLVLLFLAIVTLPIDMGIHPFSNASLSDLRQELLEEGERDKKIQAIAASLDATLDRCGIQQYLVLASQQQEKIYGHTKHTPLNHYIFSDLAEESAFHPSFMTIARERLHAADLIVTYADLPLPSSPFGFEILEYIQAHFTSDIPSCADKNYGDYRLFFRTDDATVLIRKPAVLHTRSVLDYRYSEFEHLDDKGINELKYAAMRELGLTDIDPTNLHIGVFVQDIGWNILLLEKGTLAVRGYLVLSNTDPPVLLYKETPKDSFFHGPIRLR